MSTKIIGFSNENQQADRKKDRKPKLEDMVLAAFFETRKPCRDKGPGVTEMTSKEISEALEDVCFMTADFISRWMFEHGYVLRPSAGKLRWLMTGDETEAGL